MGRFVKILRNFLFLLVFFSIFGGVSISSAQEITPTDKPVYTVSPTSNAFEDLTNTDENINPENPNLQEDVYLIGEVAEVLEEGVNQILDTSYPYQILKIKIYTDSGTENIQISNEIQPGGDESQRVAKGDRVVITKVVDYQGQVQYFISDRYRFPSIILLFLVFFLITVAISKFKGFSSILGLFFSIIVLANYVVPGIINGQDPFLTCIIGALLITPISIYLAHGFNKRTSLALASTLISIFISAILAVVFVDIAKLFGTGSEDAYFLKTGLLANINLKGLLLGGIIFGAVGVLDDVTTAQTAAVDEISKADKNLGFRELFSKGISVGKEHISSLVNTLVLAYVGSSFPLLLLFSLNNDVPIWVKYNSEFIVEEVVRTLIGSTTLVLAVPIATFIAAYFMSKKAKSPIP